MKVKTPYSGIEIDFHLAADEVQCEEFLLLGRPTSNNDSQPLKECYVSVQAGRHITIFGHLTGRLAHARFDLLVDGSYAGTRIVEPGKGDSTKQHSKRRIDFRSVQTVLSDRDDPTSTNIVEGGIRTVPCPAGPQIGIVSTDGKAFGVGSIVVLVSLQERCGTPLCHAPDVRELPDCAFYSWMQRNETIYDPGIPPTTSLMLQDITDGVTSQKANAFRTRFRDNRFGHRTFAKLVFYYRENRSIVAAGCMPLPHKGHIVEQEYIEPPPIGSPVSRAIHPNGEPAELFIHDETAAPKKTMLGGNLVLKTVIKQSMSFAQLVDKLTSERQAWRRYARTATQSEEHVEPIGPSVGATGEARERTSHIEEPSSFRRSDEIMALVSKKGVTLYDLMAHFFPEMSTQDPMRHRAAAGLLLLVKGLVRVIRDTQGRQLVVRMDHEAG